jgi:steroid delta-isomerase-like uncharacterized protein
MTSVARTRTPEEVALAVVAATQARDPDAMVALGHPDYIDEFVPIGEKRGKDAIRSFFAEMFAAFPDFEFEAERIVADDRHAVLQWKASGTFTGGGFQGIEPTGRRVVNRGVDVMEIDHGLLRRITIYYDGLGVARAMGVLPPKGSFFERTMLFLVNIRSKLRLFFKRLFDGGR